MAAGRTRRSLIKALGAAALGTLGLAGARRGTAASGCKGSGKACSKGSQCCSGLCVPPPAGKSSVAQSGSVCCAPEPPATTCAGTCGSQTNNCGQTVDCGACSTVTIDYSPTGDPRYCSINIHLRDFAPSTEYTVDLYTNFPGDPSPFRSFQVTTDANGDADVTPGSLCNQSCNPGLSLRAAVGTVSSEFVLFACSA